jgi:hypothetical protein
MKDKTPQMAIKVERAAILAFFALAYISELRFGTKL